MYSQTLQPSIVGSLGFIFVVSTITTCSKLLSRLASPNSGFVRLIGSFTITGLFIRSRDSVDGSKALVFMKVDFSDCLGTGPIVGGVGGAWLPAKGFVKGNCPVVGVPLYDEGDDV